MKSKELNNTNTSAFPGDFVDSTKRTAPVNDTGFEPSGHFTNSAGVTKYGSGGTFFRTPERNPETNDSASFRKLENDSVAASSKPDSAPPVERQKRPLTSRLTSRDRQRDGNNEDEGHSTTPSTMPAKTSSSAAPKPSVMTKVFLCVGHDFNF